jgi:hypothetical protein
MARSRASSKVRCLDVPLLFGACHNSKTAKSVGRLLPALPPPHPVPAPPPPPPQPVPAPAACFCFCGVVVAETMSLKGRLMHALRYLGGCFTTTDCSSPKLSCCSVHNEENPTYSVVTQYHYHYNQPPPPPPQGPRVSHGGSRASEASQVNRSGSRARSQASNVSSVVAEAGSSGGVVAEAGSSGGVVAGSSSGSNLC